MILGGAFAVDVDSEVDAFTRAIRRNLSLWRRITT
jgi:hypothetical protein